jgi:hypothetical protein
MLIEAWFTCAGCGERNDTSVDPSQGVRQSYVEDCQVCCRANVLSVVVRDDDEAEIEATLEA